MLSTIKTFFFPSANAPRPKNNILAIALDFDGCYCYIQNKKITDHSLFHQYLIQIIQEDKYEKIILLVGSLRQSRDSDVYNHTHNQNGSITQSLPYLQNFLKKHFNIPVQINSWLLEDVVLGYEHPKQFYKHKTFIHDKTLEDGINLIVPRHMSTKYKNTSEVSKQFHIDRNKMLLILFQTHLLNKLNSESNIRFIFVDDTAERLLGALKKIPDYETLIPTKLNFQFIKYLTGSQPCPLVDVIYGSGKNFLNLIKLEIWAQVNTHQGDEIVEVNTNKIIQDIKNSKPRQNFSNQQTPTLFNPPVAPHDATVSYFQLLSVNLP